MHHSSLLRWHSSGGALRTMACHPQSVVRAVVHSSTMGVHWFIIYAASHGLGCRTINHMHSPKQHTPVWKVDTMCASVFFWRCVPIDLWTTGANSAKLPSFSSLATMAGGTPKPYCITPTWDWQVCTSENMPSGWGLENAFGTVNRDREGKP